MNPPDRSAPVPLVSVIVRSMDRPLLAACLDSIARQDLPALEVVLVNASGRPHSDLPTAGGHALRRVDPGRALSRPDAANAGLDAAAGRYVIFLDDDDVYLPGHVARLLAALQSRPEAVAAYADVAYGRHGPQGWAVEHVFAADFDPLRLRFENYLPLNAVLVDRGKDAVLRCRFDESLPLFEDWDWWLQLARLGPFVRVPGVSALYVAADGGSSGVFADSAVSSHARRQLLLKWLARDTPDQQLALLQALQTQFRAALQAGDQLAQARRSEQDLRALISAREEELANTCQVLSAREQEIANYALEVESLRRVLAGRERELVESLQHNQGLQQTLAARDEEITHLRQPSIIGRLKP